MRDLNAQFIKLWLIIITAKKSIPINNLSKYYFNMVRFFNVVQTHK